MRLARHAMGTRFELVLDDPARDTPSLRALGESALELVQEWHDTLNRFDEASPIARLNRDGRATLDQQTLGLLRRCDLARRETRGALDIAMGAPPPELDATTCVARLGDPHARIDLGAVAKGFVLDLAAGLLREHSVASALLHGGTSAVVAIGAPRGEDAWRIALGPAPTDPRVTLRDAALAVSSQCHRAHVIDPRTGEPIAAERTAAVVGPSAFDCDVWSTALLVLGERPTTMPDRLASLIGASDRGWGAGGPGGFPAIHAEGAAA